ncbi:MAG TPA: GNAT family N-acetyltransferase [Actinomycetota bacterium]|nr:GNAT family N-acetyltransferase [Actinomycetota bacterium]
MAPLPTGYSVRPATRADLPALGALARAADIVDWGRPNTSDEEIADDWSLPGLELATDTWVICLGDEVCAYAWMMARKSHCRLDGWGVVHPDHRGRGLGSFLLDLVEKRAVEHAALAPPDEPVIHATNVAAPDKAAHELLHRRGFNLVRRFWRMDGDMPLQNPSPPAPAKGITIRTFVRGQDESDVHAAFEEAFAEHFGHVPWPFDDWIATRIQSEGFDPRLWFLAVDGDRIVGALAGRIIEDVGWVETLGVRPRWRRRGIGENLLRRSFAEFHQRGIHKSSLYVDSQNETGATALYERVGMQVATQFDFYEKHLRPEAGAPRRSPVEAEA